MRSFGMLDEKMRKSDSEGHPRFITRLVLFVFVSIYSLEGLTQRIFLPGEVVLSDGTAIECSIHDKSFQELQKGVTVKLKKSGEIVNYKPEELQHFTIGNDYKFVSHIVENIEARQLNGDYFYKLEKLFLRQLEEGPLSLYLLQNPFQNWFYIKKDILPLQRLEYIRHQTSTGSIKDIFVSDTLGVYKVNKTGHFKLERLYIDQIRSLVKDCVDDYNPDFYLKENELRRIVKGYNECSVPENERRSYKPRALKIKIYVNYISGSFLQVRQSGMDVSLEVLFPSAIKNVGVSYGRITALNVTNESGTVSNFLHLSYAKLNYYVFPANKLNPYFSLGLMNKSRSQETGNQREILGDTQKIYFSGGIQYLMFNGLFVNLEAVAQSDPIIKLGLVCRF